MTLTKTEMRVLGKLALEGSSAAYKINSTWRNGVGGRYQTVNRAIHTLKAKGLIRKGGLRPELKIGSETIRLTLDGLILMLDIRNQSKTDDPLDLRRGFEDDLGRLNEILGRNSDLLPEPLREWNYLAKSNSRMAMKALWYAIGSASDAIESDYSGCLREGKNREPGYVADAESGAQDTVERVLTRTFLFPWRNPLLALGNSDYASKWLVTLVCRARIWRAMVDLLEDEISRKEDEITRKEEAIVKDRPGLKELRRLKEMIESIPQEMPELHVTPEARLRELLSAAPPS